MPSFSEKSMNKLRTCHPDLQRLMLEVVKEEDCSIVEGRRDKETQDRYFKDGVTTVKWPNSKHNCEPPALSIAVDVVPYIDGVGQIWPNKKTDTPEEFLRKTGMFYMFMGYVKRTAEEMGIKIRMGADWNGNRNVLDQTFHDLPHIELVID